MAKNYFIVFIYSSISLLLLLSGCAKSPLTSSIQPASSWTLKQKKLNTLTSFEVKGKVGYTQKNEGGSSSIHWQQQGNYYSIRLYGPIGSESVNIKGHERGEITLTHSNGRTVSAQSPEALLQQELQWSIPVSGLQYWLKGLPAPGKLDTKPILDSQNRLLTLEQQGWKIQYERYKNLNDIDIPEKMILDNGKIKLKFIFKQWTLYDVSNNST